MPGEASRPVQRVLMTADAVGGVWSYSMGLASALRARGVDVTLAVFGPTMRADQRAEAASLGLSVVDAPFALEWMPNGQQDFEAAGEWLMTEADRAAAEMVHLNGFSHAALPWRVPVVVVAHSCVRTWWRAVHGEEAPSSWALYSERVAAGLRAARLVVAPTAAILAEIRAEYGVSTPSCVIPNGSMAVTAPPASSPKQRVVFSAGRVWDEAKNIAGVCGVAEQLSWPICVAGDLHGPFGSIAPSGAVRYLGPLPAAQMAQWYSRAAIYALPARYEPFGLSVVEAAAAGCALVLGDIRSLRENWSDAALFVPPDNRRAIAGAIDALIRNAAEREALAARARQRASHFTMTRMVDAYMAAYAGLFSPAAAA
jgi:glycogen synthase